MVKKMYLKCDNKKIPIKEYNTIKEKIKSLKFVLKPLDYGIKIPNKRIWNTYFFCQKVDILITDKEEKIIKKIENTRSEKLGLLGKKRNIYYLPQNTIKQYKIGDKINIKE